MKIYEHLETFLGNITHSFTIENSSLGVQVLQFHNTPQPDVITYSTLGVSHKNLYGKSGKEYKQEFIFAAYKEFDSSEIASLLLSLAETVIKNGNALLRGEILGEKQLFNGVEVKALYSSIPVLWEDGFYEFSGTTPATIFVWLLPLMSNEFHFIKNHGWNTFEDKLEISECDFWDLNRNSIVM